MFNKIIDEVAINDGTIFVHFSTTSFVIGFICCTTTVCVKIPFIATSFFVFKFVVRVVSIPMATLLGIF
jgi:hypothetical protein